MPPDNKHDFELQLGRTLQELSSLRSSLRYNVFLTYYSRDFEKGAKVAITPQQLVGEFISENLTVQCQAADTIKDDIQVGTTSIKDSIVVVVMMTDGFADDKECNRWFSYIQQTLKKPFLLVLPMKSRNWQKSKLGMLASDSVFINMANVENYNAKRNDLFASLSRHLDGLNKTKPECFVSYCWSNSREAIKKGSKNVENALGWGDPREIKHIIEERTKVKCWLDIEQAGKEGLFKDINDGLKDAKIVIACVSDEVSIILLTV